jgi:hypothetical protein
MAKSGATVNARPGRVTISGKVMHQVRIQASLRNTTEARFVTTAIETYLGLLKEADRLASKRAGMAQQEGAA